MKQYYYVSYASFRLDSSDRDIPVYDECVAFESDEELKNFLRETHAKSYYPVNFFAIMQTNYEHPEYRKLYIRDWEDDIDSLREHIKNMSDDGSEVATLMIRPATDEEVEWYNSDNYTE